MPKVDPGIEYGEGYPFSSGGSYYTPESGDEDGEYDDDEYITYNSRKRLKFEELIAEDS